MREYDAEPSKLLTAACIAILRIQSSLCTSYAWHQATKSADENDPGANFTIVGDVTNVLLPEENVTSVEQIQEIDSSNDNFICRICEEVVPLDMIEVHSHLCITAHSGEVAFYRCSERLKPLRDALQAPLSVPWPGTMSDAVTRYFPIAYFKSLLSLAINTQIQNPGAESYLGSILSRMNMFVITEPLRFLSTTFVSGKLLVQQQRKAASEIITASLLIPMTRRRRSSSRSRAPTTLADFVFLGRISSGAFARVYLSRKVSTGDLYAIKVLKKSKIALKNQILAVSAERDILKSLRSPYIVNFCMFSF
jgi:hypothetical protein